MSEKIELNLKAQVVEPKIRDYEDYRLFLKDFVDYRRSLRSSFSYRVFGRLIGKDNAAYIARVISGLRNLPEDLVRPTGLACGLQGDDLEFFMTLVHWNQETSEMKKDLYLRKLKSFYAPVDFVDMKSPQWVLMSVWFYPILLELVGAHGFRENPHWISKKLRGIVTPTEVALGLERLERAELLVRVNGKLSATAEFLAKKSDISSDMINEFHTQMGMRGFKYLRQIPMENREYSSSTFTVRAEDMPRLKRKLQQMRQEIMKEFGSEPLASEIVQLNLQLFPMTDLTEGE